MKKLLSVLFLLSFTLASVFAQNIQVKGTVVSGSDNEPLPGVNVVVKGNTSIGTITGLEGDFTLSVPADAILSISYIGFKPQEIAVGGKKLFKIVLQEDTETLDEVVVVGYGVQKKSVVTASIAKVSADDLAATAPVRMDNALKGLAAGVTVTSSSGQPGAAAQIRVRGIGTTTGDGAADPLYIVDGMPIDGGLDYLNPNDIASIEVLKDAASGAVYGARAANGVILVTTKTGKIGKTKVTYDFSYGWQSAWKKRDVLNATEYAVLMNEGAINAGVAPTYSDPYSYGVGTNWQNEVFNDNAPVMNHQVSVSGASEKVSYLLSAGYYTQDGIVGGNFGRSNYERLTLRSNTQYTIFDESKTRNWLNNLKITSNISYARIKNTDIEANSTWGSPLGSALSMSPMLSPYVEGDSEKAQLDYLAGQKDYVKQYGPNGKLLMVPVAFGNYQEMNNPIANLLLPGKKNWSHKFVANFSAEMQLWDNLKFKTSYGVDLAFWGNDGYTPIYYLRNGQGQTFSSAFSEKRDGTTWQLENVLMYDKTINKHSFSVILGQSAKKNSGSFLTGSRNNISNYNRPYIDASTGLAENGDRNSTGAPTVEATLASLFARASYNYDERYMFQFTIRRDGSSRFGSNNHWATFPSFSLGWNLTNESFMAKRPDWLTTAKVRFSWGKNGNEKIGDFQYIALAASGNNAIFGQNETVINGVKASQLPNPDLKWEESEQTDLGVDLGFFNNALTFSVDYYIKKTNGMLMTMALPSYVGEKIPLGNVGKMENKGVEMEANYRFNAGDWNFRVGGNLTYLKNKLIEYGNEAGWANLDSFQGTGTISRAQNGKPFPFFYGYKTDGVLQNQAEADAYNSTYGTSLVPGDVRFVDVDNSGTITEDDRTDIGKGMPDWTYGFNLNVAWKNFDLNMMWQGTAGNDVYDATRRTDAISSNLPSWMLNRWTGEGTSNRIPRYVQGDSYNWQSSDLLVYDGSYLRLKNIQLGYTLPKALTEKVFVSSLRFYVAAENLLTFTKYHGFDPEISSGGTSLGIDYGVYPQARTWTIGVNLAF